MILCLALSFAGDSGYNCRIMSSKPGIRSQWVIITDGTNIFDAEFRAGALELAHERAFHNIRLMRDELIMDKSYLTRKMFKTGCGGIICHPADLPALRVAARAKIPVILLGESAVSEWRKAAGGPVTVCSVDNEGIGQMAADYLYGQRRFKSFVYADYAPDAEWDWWTDRRFRSFTDTLAEHGFQGEVPRIPVAAATPDEDAVHFVDALKDLPRPIAIFACNDRVANDVVTFLELSAIRMPSEVAVLGVDDERDICETAAVKISSIKIEHHRLGRTAMTLMLHMLQGGERRDKTILCPPVRVIERESTRRLAPTNPHVAAALDFIRAAEVRKLSVESVAKACSTSHSYLSKNFKRETGLTVLDAIHDRIVKETKRLLSETDIPVSEIAEEMGFSAPSGLCALFKRKTGTAMKEFRRKHTL